MNHHTKINKLSLAALPVDTCLGTASHVPDSESGILGWEERTAQDGSHGNHMNVFNQGCEPEKPLTASGAGEFTLVPLATAYCVILDLLQNL